MGQGAKTMGPSNYQYHPDVYFEEHHGIDVLRNGTTRLVNVKAPAAFLLQSEKKLSHHPRADSGPIMPDQEAELLKVWSRISPLGFGPRVEGFRCRSCLQCRSRR